MDKKIMAGGALTGLVFAGGLAGLVSAQAAANETALTKDQIIKIALSQVPGEVQEIELERDNGVRVYEVEILTADGIEMEVEIAAETGDVLEIEADDDGYAKHDDTDNA